MSDDGGGGLGVATVVSIAESVVRRIFGGYERIETLIAFATNPLRFLRARVIPVVLGAIFGFVFDLATIVARPFQAIIGALTTLSVSLTGAVGAVTDPIADALALSAGFLVSLTTPFGPLQPFALAALAIAIGYGIIVVSVRIGRAAADSIPVVSGIETFLFG